MGRGPFATADATSVTSGSMVVDREGKPFCYVAAHDCHGGDKMAAKARAQRITESLNKTEGHTP